MWVIVITAVAGIGGTGIGGLVGAIFSRNSEKIVSLLLSFAGGVMLGVVCLDLLLNAVEQIGGSMPGLLLILAAVLAGYGIIYLLNYLIDISTNPEVPHIDRNHPKTADQLSELIHSDHYEEHKKNRAKTGLFVGGLIMACAIALHNLPEGMVIGSSYAQAHAAGAASLALAVVIGLHNIPEGMSVAVPLIAGGMKKGKAIVLTAATGIPTVLGAMLGYYLGTLGPMSMALSLSFASGAMLYVVFGELLPEAILMWKSKGPAFATLIGLLTGIFIIFA